MSFYPEMVWLDLDDTLFDHSHSVACGLERVQQEYPAFSIHRTAELVRLYNLALEEVYPDYLRGKIDFPEMRRRKFDRFCRKVGVRSGDAPDATTFHKIYDDAYARARRVTPGSVEGVRSLMDRGISVAVLTNGTERGQEDKLRVIGFDFLVPHLLTSEKAGAAKPDPRIFEWALERTGKRAQDVVMIGDNPVNDITGALSAGIRAIHYDRSAVDPTFATPFGKIPVLSDWNQLLAILQALPALCPSTEAVTR
jgi:HAD superfamily hydrolase (TIGR01509 family)